jgi:hypothetical protein
LSLNLAHKAIGPEGVKALAGCDALFLNLTELNLSFCLIESGGAAALSRQLRSASYLVHLDVSGNGLGNYGVGCLVLGGLDRNPSLRMLVLDRNKIGDSGAAEVVTAMARHGALEALSLALNMIGPAGALALSKALSSPEYPLKHLNLEGNAIGSSGCGYLGEALKKNQTLTELNLAGNQISDAKMGNVLVLSASVDGVSVLISALSENKTLLSLNIAGGKFDKSMGPVFSRALAQNKSLCKLVFDEHEDVGFIDIALKKNTSISDVGPRYAESRCALRNKKEGDGLGVCIKSEKLIRQAEAILSRGVNFTLFPVVDLLRFASVALVRYYHITAPIRAYLFDDPSILKDLLWLPAPLLKDLAAQRAGHSFLLYAASQGNSDAVSLMLDHWAPVNQKDHLKRTPLILAAELGHHEVVKILLKRGGDPDITIHGLTAVHLSVMNGHVKVLEAFVDFRKDCVSSSFGLFHDFHLFVCFFLFFF